MGHRILVEENVIDAIAFIGKLDKSGYSPTFAAWYYNDDDDRRPWIFLIASPKFDRMLQSVEQRPYLVLIENLAELRLEALDSDDLNLMETHHPLIAGLVEKVDTGPVGIARKRFEYVDAKGLLVVEAVVLRSYDPGSRRS